jgi:hypothetical protein
MILPPARRMIELKIISSCNYSDYGLNQGIFDMADRDITFSKSQGGLIEYNAESGLNVNNYTASEIT